MLTGDEKLSVDRMRDAGATWLIVALMLTMDRQANAIRGRPRFGVSEHSFDIYSGAVADLTAEYGPSVIP